MKGTLVFGAWLVMCTLASAQGGDSATLQRELEGFEANREAFGKMFPPAGLGSTENLLTLIQETSERSMASVQAVQVRQPAASGSGLSATTLKLRVAAPYTSVLQFLNRLERSERFLRIDALTLELGPPDPEDPKVIPVKAQIEVRAYTYRPKGTPKDLAGRVREWRARERAILTLRPRRRRVKRRRRSERRRPSFGETRIWQGREGAVRIPPLTARARKLSDPVEGG
ncbi:MAG: hypothetical protein JKY65_22910 [Planctomycetes bacterium]|nr:hypothetical protein [Planctomycetota bacterium]